MPINLYLNSAKSPREKGERVFFLLVNVKVTKKKKEEKKKKRVVWDLQEHFSGPLLSPDKSFALSARTSNLKCSLAITLSPLRRWWIVAPLVETKEYLSLPNILIKVANLFPSVRDRHPHCLRSREGGGSPVCRNENVSPYPTPLHHSPSARKKTSSSSPTRRPEC